MDWGSSVGCVPPSGRSDVKSNYLQPSIGLRPRKSRLNANYMIDGFGAYRGGAGWKMGETLTGRGVWTASGTAGEGGKKEAPGGGLFSTPGCPGSIVSAEAFHFRVRDGNGWFRLALVTRDHSFVPSRGLEAGDQEPTSDLQPRNRICLVAGVGLEPTTSGL
jgi:hypothetical protein